MARKVCGVSQKHTNIRRDGSDRNVGVFFTIVTQYQLVVNLVGQDDQIFAPGQIRHYFFYADTEKIGSAIVSDFAGTGGGGGAPELSSVDGLYGAVVVAPKGAEFTHTDGSADPGATGTQVDVHVRDAAGNVLQAYRDATLVFADTEKQLAADFMPYPLKPGTPARLNYANEAGRGDDQNTFSSIAHPGDTHTMVRALEGDQMVFHVIGTPGSDQMHMFSLGGLSFEYDHYLRQAGRRLSEAKQLRGFGPWETFDAWVSGPDPSNP